MKSKLEFKSGVRKNKGTKNSSPLLLLLLAILWTGVLPPVAQAKDDAFQTLRDVVQHQETVVFEGVKTIARLWGKDANIYSVRILKEKYHERFDYLPSDGHPYQAVIINGKHVYYVKPSKNLAFQAPFTYHGPKETILLDLAEQNYIWQDEGIQTVAGMETHNISATLPEGKNPVALFWVDKIHHLILKEERLDPDSGQPYFLSYFSYIAFPGDVSDSYFLVPPGYRVRKIPAPRELQGEEAIKSLNFKPNAPKFTPPGFHLIGTYLTQWRHYEKFTYVYSNGLQDFSVYESLRQGPYYHLKNSKILSMNRRSMEFLDNSGGKLIRFSQGPLTVAVVGNLSRDTLARVALSTGASTTPQSTTPIHKMAHYFMRGLRTIGYFLGFRN